jgi:hypothetical protein
MPETSFQRWLAVMFLCSGFWVLVYAAMTLGTYAEGMDREPLEYIGRVSQAVMTGLVVSATGLLWRRERSRSRRVLSRGLWEFVAVVVLFATFLLVVAMVTWPAIGH